MSLTKNDLRAIKELFDTSFDERVPKIIDERVPSIIERYIDELKLDIGQFSLETTKRFDDLEIKLTGQINSLEAKLSGKVDDLYYSLNEVTEMANTNKVEITKIKRNMGMT